jgi:subtilisin family serine protease
MERKVLIALLFLGGALLVAAGVVLIVSLSAGDHKPDIDLPASLDDLAQVYPDLAHILQDPELGTVYKEFLIVYEQDGEESALQMARERGIVVTNVGKEYVRLMLVLDTSDNAPLVAQLEEIGIIIVSAYRDQVEVAIPIELVRQQLASDDPGALFERLTGMEHVVAVRLPVPRTVDDEGIEGEGVDVIDAEMWHQAGVTGQGLRVGVLDLGFEGYEDLLGTELPESVVYEEFGWLFEEPSVHGTACAEIVHEIAPEAELVLALYDGSDAAFGEAVEWLVEEQDVDIISHSAGGLVGPRDGSEWDAQLVDELAGEGILWVNAAGNDALAHHRGQFLDTDGNGVHEFEPDEETMAIYNYADSIFIALSWDDDWKRPTQDYQMLLYDKKGDLLASSRDVQAGKLGQEPVEMITLDEVDDYTVYVAVVVDTADRDVTFDIFVWGGEVEYPTAGYSISPPADAMHSLTVGAVEWWDDGLAEYSSQGPTADERLKPDISAPTGVSGSSYGSEAFDGTSASCPHVAGAAALVWQAHPDFTRQDTVNFLLEQAVDLGPTGPDTGYGYGRLHLPENPDVTVIPRVTETLSPTLGPTGTPGPTNTPMPTVTPVDYAIPTTVPPTPAPQSGMGTGTLVLAGGVVVLLLGCGGATLLMIGGFGLIILGRSNRRVKKQVGVRLGLDQETVPVSFPPQVKPKLRTARCQHCGAAMRSGARFCSSCGRPREKAPRPRQCLHCGTLLKREGRFCPTCGRPV